MEKRDRVKESERQEDTERERERERERLQEHIERPKKRGRLFEKKRCISSHPDPTLHHG